EYRRSLRYQYSGLAETHLQLQDHREAAKAAQELPPLFPNAWNERLSAGWFLARCAALAEKDTTLAALERSELARAYADQSVQRLQEAIQRGYKDLNYLKTNEYLEVLRRRDDFTKLLNEFGDKLSGPYQK